MKPANRVRGYYAMPLLWGEAVIGWVTCARTPGGLDVRAGYHANPPRGQDFTRAFDAEVARMDSFLGGPGDGPMP